MTGVQISGPSLVYGENLLVVRNSSIPESTLNKKLNSICCHYAREAVAKGEILVGYIPLRFNPADLCTKVFPGGVKKDGLIDIILHNIAENQ